MRYATVVVSFVNVTAVGMMALLPPLSMAGASAQAPIPEVVVTADLRQGTAMETPGSVAIVTEEVIAARQVQHFEDLVNSIPNMNFASGSNRARFFQIRGIGERSQFINPINPSVGFLVDHVDFSGAATIATMMDVQQVEVLRGPQGTRYGANALAGLINVTTNEPTADFSLRMRAALAEYNTESYGMVINGAISERLNGRLVLASHKSDGYIENDFLRQDDTNGRDEFTARVKLNCAVDDDWDLSLSVASIDIDNGYDAFSLDNTPRHTLSDEPGQDAQDSAYMSVKSEWRLPGFRIEAFLNGASSDINYGYDEDWTYAGFHPDGYSWTDYYLRDKDTRSAEVRLVSSDASRLFGGSTDWLAGLYYLTSDEDLRRIRTRPTDNLSSNNDFDTLAAFFQLNTALGDRLTLHTGFRLEERDTSYDDSNGVSFSPSDSLWGGRISLEYQLQSTMLYGSIARGYKASGFNTGGSLAASLRTFDEEYLVEYELGWKGLYANERLQVQAALFVDDRHDQQVKTCVCHNLNFTSFLDNAAEGTNRGVEINVQWAVTDKVQFNAGAGWLDAKFDDFTNDKGDDLSGRDQAHAPGYTYSFGFNYTAGPWSASVSADGKDEFFFSDSHAIKSDSYTIYNASVATRQQVSALPFGAETSRIRTTRSEASTSTTTPA
ncbi:MAG: TonB-dependent receptor [Pseudomonadales bacterium]